MDKTNNELWCNFLVNAFYNHRFETVNFCTRNFYRKYDITCTLDEYKLMSHFPKPWDLKMTVFGYLTAYYPYIAIKLEELDEYDLVERLALIKLLQKYKKKLQPTKKMTKERKERKIDFKNADAEQTTYNLVRNQRKANSGAVWNQCK